MTAKPTPEGLDHFIDEVRKANTPDDVNDEAYTPFENELLRQRKVLEQDRQKMLDELTDDIEVKFSEYKDFNIILKINDYIRNWQPRGE